MWTVIMSVSKKYRFRQSPEELLHRRAAPHALSGLPVKDYLYAYYVFRITRSRARLLDMGKPQAKLATIAK